MTEAAIGYGILVLAVILVVVWPLTWSDGDD
jgi:hypothetical protein